MRSGEFAQLCSTTKNTLIHYDELGILRPTGRDANGYRRYTMLDFTRFNVVRALTQAGFSLAQVRDMLDTPSPARLAQLARDNAEALEQRIEELRRSMRLLAEIERQAASAEAAGPDPEIITLPARFVLATDRVDALTIDGNWDEVFLADAQLGRELASLGPEEAIAPYGMTATVDKTGAPRYDGLFYLLPHKPKVQAEKASSYTFETLPQGTYARLAYASPWSGVGEAYRKLRAFLADEGLAPGETYYEISQTRFLDTDSNHYRCTLEVKVES